MSLRERALALAAAATRRDRLPFTATADVSRAVRRTRLTRIALAVALVVSLLVALVVSSSRRGGEATVLPRGSDGVIVLDSSYSITPDTYRVIDWAFGRAMSSGERWGLVLFSDVAYEALPPRTPARELDRFRRFFVPVGGWPPKYQIGENLKFRRNPWFDSFAGGTRISTGLRLAKDMLERDQIENGAVLLVSDLADSGTDLPLLTETLIEYARSKTPLKIIALSATKEEKEFFERLLRTPGAVTRPPQPAAATAARTVGEGANVSVALGGAVLVILVLAALNELLLGRLTWRRFDGEETA